MRARTEQDTPRYQRRPCTPTFELTCAMNAAGTLLLASSPRICSLGSHPPEHPVPMGPPAAVSCTCITESQWPRTSTEVALSQTLTSSWGGAGGWARRDKRRWQRATPKSDGSTGDAFVERHSSIAHAETTGKRRLDGDNFFTRRLGHMQGLLHIRGSSAPNCCTESVLPSRACRTTM